MPNSVTSCRACGPDPAGTYRVALDELRIVGDGRQVLAAQRHAKIMGQFEKLFSGPRENRTGDWRTGGDAGAQLMPRLTAGRLDQTIKLIALVSDALKETSTAATKSPATAQDNAS
jgi:hypothetical protein